MILELLITKDFYFLGRKYESGDVIFAELSIKTINEISEIYKDKDDEDELTEEEEKSLSLIKREYSEDQVRWILRPLTQEEQSKSKISWKGFPHHPPKTIFCKHDYNLSASEFMYYLYSINQGKVFPEDVETGYKIKTTTPIEDKKFVPVSDEAKTKIIKSIMGNRPDQLEALNKRIISDPESNIFNLPILSNDEIIEETLDKYDEHYKKGQFFEFKEGDGFIIMEVLGSLLEMENGFKGYDYRVNFYKSNADYSDIEYYENFSEIYFNTLKKADTHRF